jgi:hypothetical protein
LPTTSGSQNQTAKQRQNGRKLWKNCCNTTVVEAIQLGHATSCFHALRATVAYRCNRCCSCASARNLQSMKTAFGTEKQADFACLAALPKAAEHCLKVRCSTN